MVAIITAGISAFIAAAVSLITLYQNHKWQKEDKNSAVLDRLDHIDTKLDAHIKADDEREAKQVRARILRFNDELLCGEKHSKDAFDMFIEDCSWYERFCDAHPDFHNGIADMAIQNGTRLYAKCMEDNSFL